MPAPSGSYLKFNSLASTLDGPPGVSAVKIKPGSPALTTYTEPIIPMVKYPMNPVVSNTRVTASLTQDDDATVSKMLTTKMNGIEGMPYQFMESVDRRITGTEMGRKYTEKIVARLPLLFLTPCKQVFMADANNTDRNTITQALMNLINPSDAASLLSSSGNQRYYTVEYDYPEYYKYLNCMLASLVSFLGIQNEEISFNGDKPTKLGNMSWQNELNQSFKTFFSAEENVVFYLDGMTSVSENFGNETTESSLASQINGISDTVKEIKFLLGNQGSALANVIDGATDLTASIGESLSGVAANIGGGIVGSLADGGINTVLNGGKIVFPQIWSNSSYDRSYDVTIKLRSPDHDTLSIFLNVLKPYCRILALCLPRLMADEDGNNPDPNGYRSPFLVKAYCKGLFNIDMGIISSLSITKGDECCWNDDGLPTQIDINLTITDLYSTLSMSGFGNDSIFKLDGISHIVNNTAYMDYLANMAGMNITEMESSKKIHLYYYLTKNDLSSIPSRIHTRFDKSISKLLGDLYKRF